MAYCRGGKQMLVFAVLCDKSGITADADAVVVVHRPAHQLVRAREVCRVAPKQCLLRTLLSTYN